MATINPTEHTTRDQLNIAVRQLAKLDRPTAVAIPARFGAMNTPQLKQADWSAVFEACEQARAKLEGSATP